MIEERGAAMLVSRKEDVGVAYGGACVRIDVAGHYRILITLCTLK
jgi:hypothetical protein